MADLGIMGLGIPVEYGGEPADRVTTGLVVKELARGDVNCAYAATFSGLISVIAKYANEEIKNEWLPQFEGKELRPTPAVSIPADVKPVEVPLDPALAIVHRFGQLAEQETGKDDTA